MECTILSEQMAHLEYINSKRFTEPLPNAVWQIKKYHVTELDSQ